MACEGIRAVVCTLDGMQNKMTSTLQSYDTCPEVCDVVREMRPGTGHEHE